jgi:hypothetical protein
VGPKAGLDRCGKSRPYQDSIPGPSKNNIITYKYTNYNNNSRCNVWKERERLTDIWFVFGILKFVMIFGNFIGVTWIL